MYKKILRLAGPIIFANILQTVYQLTDLFWVGRWSTEGVAAISLASPLIFFFISLGIGLTIAGTILVAQVRGAKRYEELNAIVGQSLYISIIFSVIVAIIGYLLTPTVIGWLGAETIVKEYATRYMQISFLGIISVFGYMTSQSLWRGMGEVKIPVYIVLGTALLNLILDPLLILGRGPVPSFGVAGAARSTLITQSIAWVIALKLMYGRTKYKLTFDKKDFKIYPPFLKKYISLAIPSGIEMSARSLGMVVLAYIIAVYGTTITAAYGVGDEILGIILFIAIGFSMATTTLSGQFFGSGEYDKIVETKNKSIIFSVGLLATIGVLVFIFANQLSAIFVPGESEVIAVSVTFMRIVSLFIWTYGIQFVIMGVFRGLGEAKVPMIITLFGLWGIEIPIAYFGGKMFGVEAVRRSIVIANVLSAAVAWFWYESWKKKHITNAHMQHISTQQETSTLSTP